MKKNRTIPFGYEMRCGKIQMNLIEAKAVQTIFESYLQGFSLSDIAQYMSEKGIPYHETSLKWNKNMVKRILENERYTGTEGFIPLITSAMFQSANEKKQRKCMNLQPVSEEIAVLKSLCICAECGQKISRITGKCEKWECRNPECRRFDNRMTDHMLISAILQIWNTVQANMNLLEIASDSDTYTPTAEVQKQENEVNHLLNSNANPEQVKVEIFKLASLKYDCCTYDDRPQKTAKMCGILSSAEQMNILDIGLLQSTVSKIAISHFCTVTLEFQNGVTIKQTIERG
ncbi:MAG: recombinase family protein [Oscillospiraceae bacterium]|nr:recombinase family protein [Oscillospiraceae bacterium]